MDSLDLNPNRKLTSSVDLWQVPAPLLILRWLDSKKGWDLLHKIVKIKQERNNVGFSKQALTKYYLLLFADIVFCLLLWPIVKLGFPGCSEVKNPPAMQETWVQSLGQEEPLEEGMSSHSSILAGNIPWTEEPGRPQSIVHRVTNSWTWQKWLSTQWD